MSSTVFRFHQEGKEEEDEESFEEPYENVLHAVERGDNKAKTQLALYKLSGRGGAEIEVEEVVALLDERVKDKDAEAMWMLGLCYEYGMGCEQDLERTEELYKRSCESGNVIGMFLMENGSKTRGSGIMKADGLLKKK